MKALIIFRCLITVCIKYTEYTFLLLLIFSSIHCGMNISCSIHVQIYTDIFNVILKYDIYPSLWRDNFIKPLFKGGCSNDPSCYRGIAISSCLSTFFIRILYNRLDKYLEKNNIICPERIGFRKGCRTSDHVFTLKTLIDKFVRKINIFLLAS